jgi:transposase
MAVADAAKACGHDVRVVPATLVRSLGVGARGIKTDERDARALCIASCRVELRSVHVPSPRATPGENSSSMTVRRTGITKAGCSSLRWVLVEAAWCLCRLRPEDPAVLWCKEIAKRRGKTVAIVALARKLIGILFAIWRDGTTYEAHRGARALAG